MFRVTLTRQTSFLEVWQMGFAVRHLPRALGAAVIGASSTRGCLQLARLPGADGFVDLSLVQRSAAV